MKIVTQIILTVIHIVLLLVCIWAVLLYLAFGGFFNPTARVIIILLISSPFVAMLYFLHKNLKIYVIIGFTINVLLFPLFYMLAYEVITSISLSIKLDGITGIFNDSTNNLLYSTYVFFYIYLFYAYYRINKNEKKRHQKLNNQSDID